MRVEIKSSIHGIYGVQQRNWLDSKIGSVVEAKRFSDYYVYLGEGVYCHKLDYEIVDVDNKTHDFEKYVNEVMVDILDLVEKSEMEVSNDVRLLELTKRHKSIMDSKKVLISIYNNASGFLWSMAKLEGGTDLGWCDHHGNCEWGGAFKTYEDALEDAIILVEKCDLERFKKELIGRFHWGKYANHLNKNYR